MCKAKNITFDQVRASAALAGLPVARMTGERTASIPSATTVGTEYTVWIQDGGAWAVCECPDGGAKCWHAQSALGLYGAAQEQAQAATAALADFDTWLWAAAPEAASAPSLPVLYCEAQDAYVEPDDETAEAIAAAIRQAERAAIIARGQQAIDDLFGVAA
jgi:hypothetical protein